MREKGRRKTVRKYRVQWESAPTAMTVVGCIAAVVLLVLRAVRMPQLQDALAGRLSQNIPAVVVLAATVLLLAVGAFLTPRMRQDVLPTAAVPLAVTCMLAGALLLLPCAYDAVKWFFDGVMPSPSQAMTGLLPKMVACGMLLGGVLGGIALIRLGFQVLARGGTCAGMSAVSVLLPVLWAWFRLAWYELSYAATVGWSEKVYDFTMVIFQLLFLFKLARLVSGVGEANLGGLLALAIGTAVTALSGCVLRVVLFFTSDAQVYAAGALVGLSDFGVGLLGLVCAMALLQGYKQTNRL